MSSLSFAFTVAPILLAAVSTAAAVPLSPGGIQLLGTGSTVALEPQLAGTVVADVLTPFSFVGTLTDTSGPPITRNGNVTGTVQSRVVHSVDGTYDFYWRIVVDPSSFLAVSGLSIAGFAPATYNAGWRADGLGEVRPAFVAQDTNGNIGFQFTPVLSWSNQIGSGESSYFLFLDTDAHGYAQFGTLNLFSNKNFTGSMQIHISGESGPYATFAPVPEPATAWTMLAGMAVLIGMRLRGAQRADQRPTSQPPRS